MDEQKKYEVSKKLVDENGNKNRAAMTLNITRRGTEKYRKNRILSATLGSRKYYIQSAYVIPDQ